MKLYCRRAEPFTADKPNDLVENDDLLTLWAEQEVGNRMIPDEKVKELEGLALGVAPDYVLTLYARERQLRGRVSELEGQIAEPGSIERIWVRQRKLLARMRKVEAMLGIASPDELVAVEEQ